VELPLSLIYVLFFWVFAHTSKLFVLLRVPAKKHFFPRRDGSNHPFGWLDTLGNLDVNNKENPHTAKRENLIQLRHADKITTSILSGIRSCL
jgi:hypothetical protein